MGYNSEVGYVIQGPKEKMLSILMTYRMTDSDPVHAKAALAECTYDVTDEYLTIRFYMQSGKWYESYPDVSAHIRFFDAFQEAADDPENHINGCFVRAGDDDGDCETRDYGDDAYGLLFLSRSIVFEVPDGEPLEKVLGEL